MSTDTRYDNPAARWRIDEYANREHEAGAVLTAVQVAVRERLVARHRRIATPAFSSCMACGVSWPCEVGQALEIIEALLVV